MITTEHEELVTAIGLTGMDPRALLELGEQYRRQGSAEKARVYLALALDSGITDARLPLAAVLVDHPLEGMTTGDRYRRAESLLLRVLKEDGDKGEACAYLCALYQKLGRPISALGFALRARRLGQLIPEEMVDRLQRKIMNFPIAAIREDPVGSRVLGLEYVRDEKTVNVGIYFLREVADHSTDGVVALQLADILCFQTGDTALARTYYALAARQGNPDLL